VAHGIVFHQRRVAEVAHPQAGGERARVCDGEAGAHHPAMGIGNMVHSGGYAGELAVHVGDHQIRRPALAEHPEHVGFDTRAPGCVIGLGGAGIAQEQKFRVRHPPDQAVARVSPPRCGSIKPNSSITPMNVLEWNLLYIESNNICQ
jgi:hypothetical protein